MVEVEVRVEPLDDARLLLDLLGRHRRPAVGAVADEVVVGARDLALVDGERLDPWHHAEALPHVDRRIGAHGRLRGQRRGPARPRAAAALDPSDELHHLVAPRVEDDDEVVVVELAHLGHARLGPVPAILVVQDHRLAHERVELRDPVRVLDDVVVPVARIVGVVREQVIGEARRVLEDLRDGRLDRRQLRPRALLVAEHVEQDARDHVLGALVPARRQRAVAGVDRVRQLLAVPRLEDRQEEVVAAARDVAPAHGTLLVHRHRVPVDAEEVQGEVAQEVVARVRARDHVGLRRRLLLEVALDDRRELVQRLED